MSKTCLRCAQQPVAVAFSLSLAEVMFTGVGVKADG
jgi:hypothetical protein